MLQNIRINLDAEIIGKNAYFYAHKEQFLIIDFFCFLLDANRVLEIFALQNRSLFIVFTQHKRNNSNMYFLSVICFLN